MKIKNYQVLPLIQLLHSLTLKGRVSLQRSKMENMLIKHHNDYIVRGIESLKNDYAIRDDQDEIIYEDADKTTYKLDIAFLEEEKQLLNEEFIIELNDLNKILILSISEILLDGEFDVSGEIAPHYVDWCEQAEKAIEYYTSKEEA